MLMLILISGCWTKRPDILVIPSRSPILIEQNGCFVTKNQFIKMVDGEGVKYYNGRKGKYYIPSNLIEIKQDKVFLKTVEEDQ